MKHKNQTFFLYKTKTKHLFYYRYKIENQESEIENLEQKLDKILKLATTAIDSGRVFVVNQR